MQVVMESVDFNNFTEERLDDGILNISPLASEVDIICEIETLAFSLPRSIRKYWHLNVCQVLEFIYITMIIIPLQVPDKTPVRLVPQYTGLVSVVQY